MTNRELSNLSKPNEQAYLFTVDILVQGRNNGQALERVMALLNDSDNVLDYRVTSGIQLGNVIDEAIRLARLKEKSKPGVPNPPAKTASPADAGPAAGKGVAAAKKEGGTRPDKHEPPNAGGKKGAAGVDDKPADEPKEISPLLKQIYQYIAGRNLVRLTVLKGRGVKLSIPCRMLNYDESADILTVYHVDEKKVYSVKLSEIDDLTVN